MQAQLRAALAALMREPLAYSKTIDYEIAARLMAAASSAEHRVRHLNYPAWQEHEYKAFQEYGHADGVNCRCIGFASFDCAVAVMVN